MMKIFFKYILIFFFLTENLYSENKIVIKVNNSLISSYEIRNKIDTEIILRNLEINQENINKFKNFSVQELINFRIKEIEILKYNFVQLDKIDVSKQIQNISNGDLEGLKNKFKEKNLDYNIFVKELKIQAAWQQLIFQLFNKKIKLDENEISKLVENLKNEKNVKEFNLSEITLSFLNKDEKDDKIKMIKKKLEEVSFEEAVKLFSESDTAINDGKLGYVNEKSLSKEIFENLKNLKEGDVSDPLIDGNSIVFLKVNDIKYSKSDSQNIADLKKKVIIKRKNDLFNLYSKSHLSKIKNSTYIKFQ